MQVIMSDNTFNGLFYVNASRICPYRNSRNQLDYLWRGRWRYRSDWHSGVSQRTHSDISCLRRLDGNFFGRRIRIAGSDQCLVHSSSVDWRNFGTGVRVLHCATKANPADAERALHTSTKWHHRDERGARTAQWSTCVTSGPLLNVC